MGLLRSEDWGLFGEDFKFLREDLQLPLLRLLLLLALLALELGQLSFGRPALLRLRASLLTSAILFRPLVH